MSFIWGSNEVHINNLLGIGPSTGSRPDGCLSSQTLGSVMRLSTSPEKDGVAVRRAKNTGVHWNKMVSRPYCSGM